METQVLFEKKTQFTRASDEWTSNNNDLHDKNMEKIPARDNSGLFIPPLSLSLSLFRRKNPSSRMSCVMSECERESQEQSGPLNFSFTLLRK